MESCCNRCLGALQPHNAFSVAGAGFLNQVAQKVRIRTFRALGNSNPNFPAGQKSWILNCSAPQSLDTAGNSGKSPPSLSRKVRIRTSCFPESQIRTFRAAGSSDPNLQAARKGRIRTCRARKVLTPTLLTTESSDPNFPGPTKFGSELSGRPVSSDPKLPVLKLFGSRPNGQSSRCSHPCKPNCGSPGEHVNTSGCF
jgi:hypothetical protein